MRRANYSQLGMGMQRIQGDLAAQKKRERAHSTALWARLEVLAPSLDASKGKPGYRSKALGGRSKEELLKDVVHVVRKLTSSTRRQLLDAAESAATQFWSNGAGLAVVLLETGKISSSSLLLSSLELSDTKVYEPCIRALLGTASHFCQVAVLKLRTVPLTGQIVHASRGFLELGSCSLNPTPYILHPTTQSIHTLNPNPRTQASSNLGPKA